VQKKSVNIITLGCSKNLVDSEILLKQFKANSYEINHEANIKTDVVVLNTCGFIDDAKEESIDAILNYVEAKKLGLIKKLFVVGCLSERYKVELEKDIPEVDGYFGVNNFAEIVKGLDIDYKKELVGERIITTPKHFAYLKISEGCDRTCSFCAIPLIRGKHISKPMEAILAEARYLVSKGVKELIVIAQDLSYYGLDIYKEQKLPELVEKLSEIDGLEWIRLHYFYPANFPMKILDVIAEKNNVCNYIDIALQHISDNVLTKMRRNISKKETHNLIEKIRTKVPDINLRTTLLVGHPGETDEDFEQLMQFVKHTRFERMGVFTYSDEDNTFAKNNYKDDVPDDIKNKRAETLMELQQDISLEINMNKIGKIFKVLIDKKEDNQFVGRTEYDSYEVDNEVIINDEDVVVGDFYQVKMIDATDFDLIGEIVT
jgi:ribosomal protein S12 methylthiotransferase